MPYNVVVNLVQSPGFFITWYRNYKVAERSQGCDYKAAERLQCCRWTVCWWFTTMFIVLGISLRGWCHWYNLNILLCPDTSVIRSLHSCKPTISQGENLNVHSNPCERACAFPYIEIIWILPGVKFKYYIPLCNCFHLHNGFFIKAKKQSAVSSARNQLQGCQLMQLNYNLPYVELGYLTTGLPYKA